MKILRRTVLLSLTAGFVVGQPMAALAAPNHADRANATVVEDNEPADGYVADVQHGRPGRGRYR
jgi:hypothetical protein